MAGDTLLFSEVLDKVHKAKTKGQKINILREHNTDSLRMIIKASFDPKIEWVLPEGNVPFKRNDAPEGTEALPITPFFRMTSVDIVGIPLLSRIS